MPRLTTRDYKRPSRSSSVSRLREFGFGVLVGAVLASAAFLIVGARARHHAPLSSHAHGGAGARDTVPHAPAPEDSSSGGSPGADAASASGPSAARSAHGASGSAGAQAPQYDFYRMLPRLNVPVARDDNQSAHAPPPAAGLPARAASGGPSYLLQVGSYRSSTEADQVRARLARAGISAQVERVAEGSRTWNRVRIGPLSEAELAKVRGQLRTANIHALLIRAAR
jgi:cell division septation protein DedD